MACGGGRDSFLPDPSGVGSSTGWAEPWCGLRPLTVYPPQMELKALKDQLEAERQAWVASCAKKEVGLDRVGRCSGLPGRSLLAVWTLVDHSAYCPHVGPGWLKSEREEGASGDLRGVTPSASFRVS